MTVDDLVKRAVALSRSYQVCASRLLLRAHSLFQAGKLGVDGYSEATDNCQAMLAQSIAIAARAAAALDGKIDLDLAAIEKSTASLVETATEIDHLQEVIAVSAALLAAVTAVAGAILDPSKATVPAAVTALLGAVTAIAGAPKKADDDDTDSDGD